MFVLFQWQSTLSFLIACNPSGANMNHDPLALIAHSNASSSQSHANPSYSPQPYYIILPSSVVDYEDEYQEELQRDSQEEKLTSAMMLLARIITQKFSIPTNNCLRHYARDCSKPRVRDAKYFREQMLLAMKDEAGSNLNAEENDFMLDDSFRDETLEELTAAVSWGLDYVFLEKRDTTDATYKRIVAHGFPEPPSLPREPRSHCKLDMIVL
ncbi:hypothetical protein Tco_0778548 [Tanacetum coccineum]